MVGETANGQRSRLVEAIDTEFGRWESVLKPFIDQSHGDKAPGENTRGAPKMPMLETIIIGQVGHVTWGDVMWLSPDNPYRGLLDHRPAPLKHTKAQKLLIDFLCLLEPRIICFHIETEPYSADFSISNPPNKLTTLCYHRRLQLGEAPSAFMNDVDNRYYTHPVCNEWARDNVLGHTDPDLEEFE